MPSKFSVIIFVITISVLFSLMGCAEFYGSRQSRYNSSVVEYLYPKKEVAEVPSIPRLSLPLRSGSPLFLNRAWERRQIG